MIYYTAAVGIKYNKRFNTQQFFLKHTDDIHCIAYSAVRGLAATGQVNGRQFPLRHAQSYSRSASHPPGLSVAAARVSPPSPSPSVLSLFPCPLFLLLLLLLFCPLPPSVLSCTPSAWSSASPSTYSIIFLFSLLLWFYPLPPLLPLPLPIPPSISSAATSCSVLPPPPIPSPPPPPPPSGLSGSQPAAPLLRAPPGRSRGAQRSQGLHMGALPGIGR